MENETSTITQRANVKARVIGILFLLATVVFMAGSRLIDSYFINTDLGIMRLICGVLLQVLDGLAVALIGILVFSVLKNINRMLSLSYAIIRIIELAVILGAGVYALFQLEIFPKFDSLLCLFTGSSGLIFSYLLYKSKLLPRILSILGLVGYALLVIGSIFDFMGIIKIYTGYGIIFIAPGGIFELFLPLWLLIKGFKRTL